MSALQRALSVLYPDQCLICRNLVDQPGALCPDCWRGVPFVQGHVCDACGAPLPGQGDGAADHCDDCLTVARPWDKGRAVMLYRDAGRRFVLALKHGDRTDLAGPAARWLTERLRPLVECDAVVVPVPVHWSRLLRRRYNQAAEIARAMGPLLGVPAVPDALTRLRATAVQDGLGIDARFANVADAIVVAGAKRSALDGRTVILVDDVMTSGATLAAATTACHDAGASRVIVGVLARAVRSP
ncbi:ComF family protein [Alphaproteobacteria bacterium GH1-50]|uniref:ComF family protein n=1 Tax=Kangsaoukella pontilimi TaxID=2691042 RepID=A0A7C9MWC3_9RHOB|nr:ComF family protein [Kangsaoukella pontilimi]MXQ08280.1 ComF family protein [Kangsaoukella pontilimi]